MAVLLPPIRLPQSREAALMRKRGWRGGWANTPSGGKLSGGVVISPPHPYNSQGFGSNTGGN